MTVSPEDIAAFADGELAPPRRADVEAAIAHDPQLAAEVERHRRLKAVLSAHFAPILDAPVPAVLRELLERERTENIIDLATRRKVRAARPGWPRWGGWIAVPALAASLVLMLMRPGGETSHEHYASGQLASALDTQLVANQPPSAPTRMLLSFRDGAGQLCRAYSGAAGAGIACHEARGWKLRHVGAGSSAAASAYRQAGSSDARIMALAQEMASGPALDAGDEAKASRDRWR